MPRKTKRKRARAHRPPPAPVRGAGDFLTVGWMVAALTTLACELMSLAATAYVRFRPDDATMALFAGYMLLVAALMGAATLALTAVVWFARRERPPRPVAVVATVIGLSPLAAMALRQVF
jgi:hypothetical protein